MKITFLSALMLLSLTISAQITPVKPVAPTPALTYGEPISLETAKKIMSAAEAFALKNDWAVAIAIVDVSGNLVLFEKLPNTQIGSIEVAIGKARTANNFKRPTKAMEDAVAGGGSGLRLLAVPGVFPIEGGELIMQNGKIAGAIGVSGVMATQDDEVSKAGLTALK
jgi:glc operon protein GlcG